MQLAVAVTVVGLTMTVYEVCLMVKRFFVVVVVTRAGVMVVVGVTVTEGLVTVFGGSVVSNVLVVVIVLLTTGVLTTVAVTVGVNFAKSAVPSRYHGVTYGGGRLRTDGEGKISLVCNRVTRLPVIADDNDGPVSI